MRIVIVKTGRTFPEVARRYGDFEDWIADRLGLPMSTIQIWDPVLTGAAPARDQVDGAVITGAHEMVTDGAPFAVRVGEWLSVLLERGTPILGICFGHQLLAHILGGAVGDHPRGTELGTTWIRLAREGMCDPLLGELPSVFAAHVSHSQTVLRPPRGAVLLATGDFEQCQALRYSEKVWGVQFHPEFSEDVCRQYVVRMRAKIEQGGYDMFSVLSEIRPTQAVQGLLRRFGDIVTAQHR